MYWCGSFASCETKFSVVQLEVNWSPKFLRLLCRNSQNTFYSVPLQAQIEAKDLRIPKASQFKPSLLCLFFPSQLKDALHFAKGTLYFLHANTFYAEATLILVLDLRTCVFQLSNFISSNPSQVFQTPRGKSPNNTNVSVRIFILQGFFPLRFTLSLQHDNSLECTFFVCTLHIE